MMSFFTDNKLIFGALGLAVSSAALGFVFGRSSGRSSPDIVFLLTLALRAVRLLSTS